MKLSECISYRYYKRSDPYIGLGRYKSEKCLGSIGLSLGLKGSNDSQVGRWIIGEYFTDELFSSRKNDGIFSVRIAYDMFIGEDISFF